ncbi:MAG: LytTR family DNA-binding domain-containing protein [Polyangiaceae bacterium]|jgi:DNA-binding LytR/AlgR family response regulator
MFRREKSPTNNRASDDEHERHMREHASDNEHEPMGEHEASRFCRAPGTAALRIAARRRSSLVFLQPVEVWAFDATDRMTFVHSSRGRFDLDLSLTEIESVLAGRVLRVHRNWLVELAHVKEMNRSADQTTLFVGEYDGAERRGIEVPVAHGRERIVREALLDRCIGLRLRPPGEGGHRFAISPTGPSSESSADGGVACDAIE